VARRIWDRFWTCTLSATFTRTSSFTQQSARYLVGKVAADLRQIQLLYAGLPTDGEICNYKQELVVLLAGGFVQSVKYGYVRDGAWVLAVSYDASYDGVTLGDDHPGSIPAGRDILRAVWRSFLVPSDKWNSLTPGQLEEVSRSLPFRRTNGTDPSTGATLWQYRKVYSKDGGSLRRGLLA
jgi:hypothetical protein